MASELGRPSADSPVGTPAPEGRLRFEVRPARPSDARSFHDLYRTVAAEGRFIRTERVTWRPGHYAWRFRRPWTPDEAWIMAVEGTRVIGNLSISREEHPGNRHVASLGMMVAPDRRGRGVGTALLEAALAWAREAGVEKIALTVYPDNEAARALYGKFGFVEEGRLTGHSKKSSGYRDEIVMGLWLVPPPRDGEP